MTSFKAFACRTGVQFAKFCTDESAATAIEYAMIAAGVSTCIAGAVMSLGSNLKTTFYDRLNALMK